MIHTKNALSRGLQLKYCVICGKRFAVQEPGLITVVLNNNEQKKEASFCYHHILEMVRKNESYLPAVNIASKDFCFFVFLKECEKNLKTRSVKNRKSKKTIRLIKDYIEKAR